MVIAIFSHPSIMLVHLLISLYPKSKERIFFDNELERDYAFLKTYAPEPNCEIGVPSRSLDETKWVVSYFRSDGPSSYVLYDKPTRTVVPLFVSNPKLLKFKFAHMEDV